ncbi:hypothetical protein DQ239_06930 [Blastococcus sp. TF02-09]|uniref:hypothetical protein n=1 Tax=Blastococcus sp. TF02-09 TaxID=2250576 RepID=UPI000DEAC89F|nr:hypothetical protein [Blastococcus sp. TF02-9]RBY79356.1 hypothetical protein DQ239_06930 [Blastococcus sp. TF02-9]
MSLVVTLLATLALVDLVRWSVDEASSSRTVAAVLAGALSSLGLAWCCGPDAWPTVVVVGVVAAAVWGVTGSQRLYRDGRTGLVAAVVMAGSTLVLLPLAPAIDGPVASWYDALDFSGLTSVSVERGAVVLVGALFLLTTGNRLVRGVLAAAGTSPTAGEASLKGGRWLGPLERTFILALAMAGDLTAAAVVIAAKGILRLPEIRAPRPPGSPGMPDGEATGAPEGRARVAADDPQAVGAPDTVAEYFLVGTFTSWILALLVAGLAQLGA